MSLLRTSSLLPAVEQEEMVHHNYALVERWREVSKVTQQMHCFGDGFLWAGSCFMYLDWVMIIDWVQDLHTGPL